MRKKLLLGTAALALVVGAGAVAQSVRGPARGADEGGGTAAQSYKSPRTQAERVADLKRQSAAKKKGGREAGSVEPLPDPQAEHAEAPAAQQSPSQQDEQARTKVRTVYPNQTGPQTPQNNASPSEQAQKAAAADSAHQAQQNATPSPGSKATSAPPAQPNVNQAAQQPAASPPPTSPPASPPAASPPQNETAQATPQAKPVAQAAQTGSTGIVALNTEQQTQVGQAIAQHRVQPLSNVTFSIAIGTAVPHSVQLRALPADLASFVPQYRGYSYFVVEDEVVIVDPASSRIVTIVPYTATARAEAAPRPAPSPKRTVTRHPPMQSKSVRLDTQDRDAVRTYLRERRTSSAAIEVPRKPQIRERVERSVTLEARPRVVYEEAPSRPFFDLFGHRDGPRRFDADDD